MYVNLTFNFPTLLIYVKLTFAKWDIGFNAILLNDPDYLTPKEKCKSQLRHAVRSHLQTGYISADNLTW